MVECGSGRRDVVTKGCVVLGFGYGQNRRLGHGDEEDQLAPRRVPAAPAARFKDKRVKRAVGIRWR